MDEGALVERVESVEGGSAGRGGKSRRSLSSCAIDRADGPMNSRVGPVKFNVELPAPGEVRGVVKGKEIGQ